MEYIFKNHKNENVVIGTDKHYHMYAIFNGIKKRISKKHIPSLIAIENYKWEKINKHRHNVLKRLNEELN